MKPYSVHETLKKTIIMSKKLILLASLACFAVVSTSSVASAQKTGPISSIMEWTKSTTGTWMGKDNFHFKLVTDGMTIWSAPDGNQWSKVTDGTWTEKSGKMIKIADGKLMWSADQGLAWREVPQWTWVGSDGKSYKFDTTWTLWVKTIQK
jgi:hypothetical protein